MRTVYHGGIEEITEPIVNIGRDNLDFGKGFYVTDLKKQAKTWAEIKSRYFMDAIGIINEYVFDFENAVKDYRYLNQRPTSACMTRQHSCTLLVTDILSTMLSANFRSE